MPWEHCGKSNSDDRNCESCGISKAEWTVVLEKTRVFQLSRKKKGSLQLRLWDAAQEELIEGEPFTLLTMAGVELYQGTLDEEGFAKIENNKLGKLCLVSFPERVPLDVRPLPSYSPLQPTPGRFACVTTKLYEFRLWELVSVLEVEEEPLVQPLLEIEEEPGIQAFLEIEEEPAVGTLLEELEEPAIGTLLRAQEDPAVATFLEVEEPALATY